jgi:hypothetical protein
MERMRASENEGVKKGREGEGTCTSERGTWGQVSFASFASSIRYINERAGRRE